VFVAAPFLAVFEKIGRPAWVKFSNGKVVAHAAAKAQYNFLLLC
jgi:hypothetical protein